MITIMMMITTTQMETKKTAYWAFYLKTIHIPAIPIDMHLLRLKRQKVVKFNRQVYFVYQTIRQYISRTLILAYTGTIFLTIPLLGIPISSLIPFVRRHLWDNPSR